MQGNWSVPAVALIVVLGAWLYAGALFSGKVLAGDDIVLHTPPFAAPQGETRPENPFIYDSAWVFHPNMLEARAVLRDLRLPVWSAEAGAGQPMLAGQQTAVFFPLNWLSDVLPFWQSLEWVALLKLIVAGLGMVLFARALGLGGASALFASLAFAFSAYMADWFAHPHSNVFILLPWLMLTAERLVVRTRVHDACWAALVVALCLLGGHPESAFLVLLATAAWFVFRVVSLGGGSRAQAKRLLLALGALGAGVGIAAIVLVPFGTLLGQSETRSRSHGPGPLSILQTFVLPEQWGRPDKFVLAGGPLNYPERTAYFGTLPLILAVAGLVLRRGRTQLFFLALGLLALGLAVRFPVYSSLAADLPGLSRIDRVRALIVCTFAGAILGAFGLQELISGRFSRRRLIMATCAGALPVLAWLAFHVDWAAPLGPALSQLPVLGDVPQPAEVVRLAAALRWLILTVVAVALVAVVVARPRHATAVAIVAVLLTAIDLVTLDRGYIPAIPLAQADPVAPPAIRYAQAHVGHARVAGRDALTPNIAKRFDLRSAEIHVLPALERRNKLWLTLGGYGPSELLTTPPRRLASLFAVKYVFTGPGEHLNDPLVRQVAPGLYENRAALPRAWIAYDWTPASGPDDALAKVQRATRADDLVRPVIEEAGAPPAGRAQAAGSAVFERDADTEVTLHVDARRPGWVVLDDTYYPGWRATVDGQEADIRPVNVAFRGVRVSAGAHTIRFVFRPTTVRAGAVISLVTLLGTLLALVITRPGRRTGRLARRPPA